MRDLAMLISEIDGARILFEDGPRPILDGDGEAVFGPGWRPVLAYGGLPPLLILPFEHEDGSVGVWFLDREMRRCGGALHELPAQMLADLVSALCPLLDGLWQEAMLSHRPEPMTDAQAAFFRLPEHCRTMLLDLYLGGFETPPRPRGLDELGRSGGVPVLDCATRRVPLVGGELHWLCSPGRLQELFDRLPGEGSLAFRSPCEGSPAICRKSIPLDTDLVAYKLYDESWDLSVFLIAGDIFNRTRALYFPENNLVLSPDPAGFAAACPDLTRLFHVHVVRHGPALFRYLADERAEPVHFWRGLTAIHLGHVLWNDYSGIERMLSAASGADAPRVLVPDSGCGPEMYGPLDEVFPALRGRVRREPRPLAALLPELYGENALLFRSSGMRVDAALRERILHRVPVRGADAPVLLLGLRTENRTATDLEGFCRALVAHLAAGPGPVTLVVDGHNSRPDGGLIWSHGEPGCAGSPIEVERALSGVVREAAAGTAVSVVDTIGAPLADSLGWARAARGFVSFWGAGLAKYRWVCNAPGLVITSRWNLENWHDLRIYSSPDRMQDPTPLSFVSETAVRDQPDAPVMIRHGEPLAPSLWNFELDLPAVMRDLDRAVGGLLFPDTNAA